VKVTLLLADAAQAAEGKLYILGGGWSVTGPAPSPSALAAYVQVPWDQTNTKHSFVFELLTSDGHPVIVGTPDGEQPLVIDGSFEVGRPAGIKPGSPIDFPLAINLGPLPLPPGQRFEWRLTIDGQADENWRLPFSTRPGPV
jgi:hypothetical protein